MKLAVEILNRELKLYRKSLRQGERLAAGCDPLVRHVFVKGIREDEKAIKQLENAILKLRS